MPRSRARPGVLALPLALAACHASFDRDDERWQRTLRDYSPPAGDVEPCRHAAGCLEREAESVIVQVEAALALRAETITLARRLEQKLDSGRPLSGADLDLLTRGTLAHVEQRDALMRVAESHELWAVAPREELEPLGLEPRLQLKGLMLSLGAALTLFDNYLLAVSLFAEDSRLRPLVNEGDPGYQKARRLLDETTLSYNSAHNRQRVRDALAFYEEAREKQEASIAADPQMAYFDQLLQSSPSYRRVRDVAPLPVIADKLGWAGSAAGDGVRSAGAEGMNLFSMLFGNTIGLVETRSGKMKGRPEVADALRRELCAGDILLEKTPFRLTDKLIPGYWGHVAIWLGSEWELRALGIWDHPVVAQYHEAIRSGRLVVEALRSGVEMNPLEQFMNVDDVCVLRDATLVDDSARRADDLLRALRQVGKSYDFNFDVETTDRIVCSEICYVVFVDIEWPTENTLGRSTISPDHVAQQAVAGRLALVDLWHDGRPVTSEPLRWLREHVGEPARPHP